MVFFEALLTIWWLVIAYIIGSIPFGLILTKVFNKEDIRRVGSGNIGTTNVLRTGSKTLAAATLILDYAKGLLPTLLATGVGFGEAYLPYLVALACILGHIFPVWLKFKGGKGVATGGGVVMALNPLLGLIAAALWLGVARVSKLSSLAALVGYALLPVCSFFQANWQTTATLLIIFIIILWTHRDNISRLLNGTESKIGDA